jgi:probable HAF family extracellular repeat protein
MLRVRRYALVGVTALIALLPALRPIGADAPTYTIEDLGTIDGLVPTPTGVNASGDVSGFVSGPAGPRAVRFRDGAWSYVAGLESVMGVANAINDHGDITGYHLTADGLRAFRYVDGTGLQVIDPLPGGSVSIGMSINNNGEVAGYGDTPTGFRGWRAPSGLPASPLPTLGGALSLACGINDAGQIAGRATLSDETQHAVRFQADDGVNDLGSLDGPTGTSSSCAIDADGHVAGSSSLGGLFHAFRYTDSMTDIDAFASPSSNAESTNGGVTVGWFAAPDGLHAFVHTASDGAVDLNTRIPADSGWLLTQAKGVNASGQIVGQGTIDGAAHAFRLTPAVPPDHTPPVISSLVAIPSIIMPPNRAIVPVVLSVTATDDHDPSPACSLSSIDGHGARPDDSAITGPLTGSVRANGGATYTFLVTCADAAGNQATKTVDVVVPPDRTPPVISSMSVNPSTIWPPNNAMVTITVSATATDDSGDTPVCKLGSITSPGAPAADSVITGTNTGSVRAVGGRVYTVTEICTDGAGNPSSASRNVTVPRDTTAPTITSLSVSPSSITPPNNAMVPVTVSVTATDDVDAAPVCFLASISGGAGGDVSVTGQYTGVVRAVGGRTYSLKVTCMDGAANQRDGSVNVVVPPDTTAPSITSLAVTPSLIWPPNGKFVGATVSVTATDNVDAAPACGITSISATEPAAGDADITGPLTASLRAVRDSDGTTRIYTIHVTCSDQAGNTTEGTVDVTVGKDHPAKLTARELWKRNRCVLAQHAWHWLRERERHHRES